MISNNIKYKGHTFRTEIGTVVITIFAILLMAGTSVAMAMTDGIIVGNVTDSSGTAIANAYVYASGPGYGSAYTDVNGNFSIDGLQSGNYLISVIPPYGTNLISNSSIVHVFSNETVVSDIILQTGGMIIGNVTTLNGTPLENAYVSILPSMPPPPIPIPTSPIPIPTPTPKIPIPTTIVTGQKQVLNGAPDANTSVYASSPGYAYTDPTGRYRLEGLSSGNYIIRVDPPYGSNLIINSTIVHVSTDETVTVDIILQTGGIITGIITTSNGTPLANAYVSVSGPGYGSASTDINGNYTMSGLPAGNYFVSVSPPYGSNLISNSTIVHVYMGETVTANIILQTGGIITGSVTAFNGNPVANAYVYASGPGYGSTSTDNNGNYTISGLPAGNYFVSVILPYGSNLISNSTIVHVSTDETVTANIILQTGGIITGSVTAFNGNPVANAYVYASGPGYGSTSTDNNGNYTISGLPAGNYFVSVILPYGSNLISNSTIVHVSTDETVTANIILQTGGIITGSVTAFNGNPVANAYVYTSCPGYGGASTDNNGNYTISGLPAGNYAVYASAPYGSDLAGNSTNISISPGETVTANIILQKGGIITGIVTTSNGTPVANAYIYAQGSGYGSNITDINGNYTLGGLQSGDYIVYAYPPYGSDLAPNSTNVTVEIGGTSMANIILPIMAIIPPSINRVEIRGEVAEGPFLWDTYNFPAFFYDFKGDVKTEILNILHINGRIIPSGQLIYSTVPEEVSFAHSNFGKYQVIGFMAEKYFAGYTKNTTPTPTRPSTSFSNMSTYANSQLHKVLIDDDTKRIISIGGTIALNEGYVLKATDIDLNARTMLLSLLKDGSEVDVTPLSANETYVYTKNISGVGNLPLIMVRFEGVFSGQELKVAFLKGLFQLSENATSVKVGNKIDKMEITTVSSTTITMNNYLDVSLEKNTNIVLSGKISLKVADNDSLRFYPFVEFTQPGKYEIRGPVFNGSTMFSLTGRTFGGFYYDLDYDRQTESLNFTPLNASISNRQIARNELEYRTTKVPVEFKVYEKEKVNVAGIGGPTYGLIGWQGEKWIAVKGATNKIAKLALEMNREDKKTLATGETWSLGSGYDLTINAVDARSIPRQVWFTLRKNGSVIDEQICQAPQSSSIADKEKALCYKTKTILGESDALLFTVYVDSIFSGAFSDMVQFKYAWLIDESSAIEIKSADKFGVFEVISATSDDIRMTNENTVNLSRNTETTLMGKLKFKVADSDNLRFYPKIDYIIGETISVPVLTYMTVSPESLLALVGNVMNFTAEPKDQNDNPINTIVTWSSSNTSVGTISYKGEFTAIAAGTTIVNATNGSVTGTAVVTVKTATLTPSITVVSPNGLENWTRGTTQTIKWKSTGSPGAHVKIELLKGVVNSTIIANTRNDGSYRWIIPSTQTRGADYKIRVTSTTNLAYTDTSNTNFTIKGRAR
jgi:S-layer protein (TIGR01567 family)